MRKHNTTTTTVPSPVVVARRRSFNPLAAALRAVGQAVVEIVNVPVAGVVGLGLGVAEGATDVFFRTFPDSEVKHVAIGFGKAAGLNKYEYRALGRRAKALSVEGHTFTRESLKAWVLENLDWAKANPINRARLEKKMLKHEMALQRQEQKHERKLEALEAKAELELAKAEATAELELAKAEAAAELVDAKAPAKKKKASAKKASKNALLHRKTA